MSIELPEGVSREKFKNTMNRLLNGCFLLKCSDATKSDYLYVIANKELFSGYLDLLGYELVINEEYGVVTLNNPAGTGRIHFSKRDSIILLILRLLYIEKKKELSQSDDIIVRMEEIYDKYNLLKLKQRLGKAVLQTAIGRFRRLNLIEALDRIDAGNMEVRLLVYPSILFAVTANSLEEMYALAQDKLEEYERERSEDGTDDDVSEEIDED